jgi:hypothetical protein
MGVREQMMVINDNLKAANKLYTDLAFAVHELVTDCWGPEQAERSKAKIGPLQQQLAEKLSIAAEMAKTLRA